MGRNIAEWNILLVRSFRNARHLQRYQDVWLGREDMRRLLRSECLLEDNHGTIMAWSTIDPVQQPPTHLAHQPAGSDSMLLCYPWHFLDVMAYILRHLTKYLPGRTFRRRQGRLTVGAGSTILPGVVVEGEVVIGARCTLGPHCYLRGPIVIGDECRVGQAVEIKNTIVGNGSTIPHLSYIGDSIIGDNVNIAAGCITANLLHSGGTVRSFLGLSHSKGDLIDSGRRKLGAVIGNNVRLGIGTLILPGRKLGSGVQTYPHTLVRKDLH